MSGGRIITDFTTGSIPRKMLIFAVPFMLSNALQVFYGIVDMVIVGQVVGSHGLSAVTNASQLFNLFVMLCMGFATGGQVYLAQLIGSGQRKRLNRTIGTLFSTILTLAIAMTLLGWFGAKWMLNLLDTPPEAFSLAMDYMRVCSVGIIFSFGYNMISAVLRGLGDSRHPFIFILIASVLNIILDLLFVAGFGWSVFGAALATILGQAVSFTYAIYFLYRRKAEFCFNFRWRSFLVDWPTLRKLISLGIPFSLQACAINFSMLYVHSLVNCLGVIASATFGVGIRLDDLVNKISLGIGFAVSSMVGQNFGAGNITRIRHIIFWSWTICFGWYALYTALFLLNPEWMFGLFTSETTVTRNAWLFASAIVWSFPAMLIMKGTQGFIQGIGNANFSFAIAFADGVLRIAFSWFFGIYLEMGLWGFIFGFGMAAYGTALPGLGYFFCGLWKRRALVLAPNAKL